MAMHKCVLTENVFLVARYETLTVPKTAVNTL